MPFLGGLGGAWDVCGDRKVESEVWRDVLQVVVVVILLLLMGPASWVDASETSPEASMSAVSSVDSGSSGYSESRSVSL